MQYIVVVIVSILIGFWAGIVYQEQTSSTAQLSSDVAAVTPPVASPFQLQVPANSLRGVIQTVNGTATMRLRTQSDTSEAVVDTTVGDGDSISTTDGQVTVAFPDVLTFSLEENSSVSLINTLPGSILVQQLSGTVLYQATESISVRTAGTLVQVSGITSITPDEAEGIITITTTDGTATLGWVGNNNEVFVSQIPESSTAVFNGADDTVGISSN